LIYDIRGKLYPPAGRPLRIEYPGAFYHIGSRGNEKKDIFLKDKG
jgi:hypothetical protein